MEIISGQWRLTEANRGHLRPIEARGQLRSIEANRGQ